MRHQAPEPEWDDVLESIGSNYIATLTDEEKSHYRFLQMELDAMSMATNVPLAHARWVRWEQFKFWNHIRKKYELTGDYRYVIDIYSGELSIYDEDDYENE